MSLEHPADPLAHYPSIWRTAEVQRLVEISNSRLIELDQCALGAPTKKPTMKMTNAPDTSLLEKRCKDVPEHTHEVLEGREVDGQFRTRRGMVYPQKLCAALARALISGARAPR